MKILLVEDNAGDSRLIQEMLTEQNLALSDIEHVDRLSKGMALMTAREFDAVLLDLGLPDSQGLNTFKKMQVAAKKTPILMLSVCTDEALALDAVRSGAQDYFIKGNFDGALLVRAITYAIERKKLGEAIRKQAVLIDLSPDAIIEKNPEGIISFWSKGAEKMYGWTRSEAAGQISRDLLKTRFPEPLRDIISQVKTSGRWSGELYHKTKDDRDVVVQSWWLAEKDEQGEVKNILESNIDITQRKKAEEGVRKSEQKHRELANFLPEIVFETDLTGKITFVNQRALEITGFTREETETGLNLLSFVTPEERGRAMENMKKSLAGVEQGPYDYTLLRKNGTTYPALVKTAPIISENKVTGLRGLALDITDRKHNEEALAKSESQYRQLVTVAQEGIWALDSNYGSVFVNPQMMEMLGYAQSEMVGKNFFEFLNKKCLELAKQFVGRSKQGAKRHFDCEIGCKNGSYIYVSIAASAIKDDEGKPLGTLMMVSDITERKVLEAKVNNYSKDLKSMVDLRTIQLKDANEQLVKSERLVAIGELAGMVGHDLRNPLAGIKSAAYFLKKKGAAISEAQSKEMLDIIDKSIAHSDKIINDLLEYAREMHLELTKYEAHTLVNEAIGTIKVPDRIQIVNHVDEEVWIWVNADKMMRVFVNLIKNAVDAMPEKGTLEISSCQTKDSIEIAFADTGTGIPKETLQKLFTPLFTTKAQGMGFGLAICKRIVEANEGIITVKTAVGEGSTFTITLPVKPKVEVGGEKTWINMPESLLLTTTKA